MESSLLLKSQMNMNNLENSSYKKIQIDVDDFVLVNEEKVRKVVNDLDPIKLISGGAPEDEYDGEVGKIIVLTQKEIDVDSLADKIYTIFLESFGAELVGDRSIYLEIAQRIKS